jgi:hypothetical protein
MSPHVSRVPFVLAAALLGGAVGADESVGDVLGGPAGDRGDGHIDFRDSGSDSYVGHITFRVDPAGGYAINVEFRGCGEVLLHAGEAGGAVRIVLHEDGLVEAGGEKLAACDPALGARITVAWSAGAAVVAVVDADGVLRSTQHALDFAPDTVSIVADEVCALSVARQ